METICINRYGIEVVCIWSFEFAFQI